MHKTRAARPGWPPAGGWARLALLGLALASAPLAHALSIQASGIPAAQSSDSSAAPPRLQPLPVKLSHEPLQVPAPPSAPPPALGPASLIASLAATPPPEPADAESHGAHTQLDTGLVWLYSFVGTTIVTALALLGIFLMPLVKRWPIAGDLVLAFLIAMSAGTLLGDAILHVAPEIYGVHDAGEVIPEDPTNPLLYGIVILLGMYMLWLLEEFLKHVSTAVDNRRQSRALKARHESAPVDSPQAKDLALDKLQGTVGPEIGESSEVRPVGYLLLVGDLVHNFVDGLSIGVSFASSLELGLASTLAVILHEFAHEIGNFSILLKAGFSYWQSAIYNALSNITCFLGMIVGILMAQSSGGEGYGSMKKWILAVTCGNFLYFGLATLVPEMARDVEEFKPPPGTLHFDRHAHARLKWVLQQFGVFAGVGTSVLVAIYGRHFFGTSSSE